MTGRRLNLCAALLSLFGLTGLHAQPTQKVTELKGDYLGQPLPGDTPMVFGRGIVSDELQQHGVPAFSPDGTEVFWQTNRLDSQKEWIVSTMTARRVGDRWTAPGISPYGSGPAFSPDGKRLYLDSKGEGADAHFVEKQGSARWSEPKSVGIVRRFPEVRYAYRPSITRGGTLYFVGYLEGQAMNLGIYRAELVNGEYAKPEALPPSINSGKGARNWTPYIAPDESFLLFCSTRGLPASDQGDLFVSFRRSDGSWSDGIGLGSPINSQEMERFPAVSPDGKLLFFTRDTPGFDEDVYWVRAGILEKLKKEAIRFGR